MTTIKVKDRRHECYISIKMKRGDMYEIIGENVSGMSALDIGCVDHDCERAVLEKGKHFLHDFICRNAKYCIGVDSDENGVMKLNELGYNCVVGDAQNLDIGGKFQVIVASNLIEHLSNVGQFLDSTKGNLARGGAS
ncbi:MAG: hypothetical protein DDT33_01336 [Firmicutes bacterium]|nr:hypothetical protein [Bacillota bacterium]